MHLFDITTSKSAPNPSVFTLLTSKCASRHNGVHFFDITTSKSAPRTVCFLHFDLEMCFAPQRRTLFGHLNFQKWSENGFFYILTWKCASRHHGVQFFISHLATWLRTSRFSEATFRPRGHKSLEKHSVWRLFYLFARLHLLSSDSVSSLIFFLLFSDSSHLCFSIPLYCRKFDFQTSFDHIFDYIFM